MYKRYYHFISIAFAALAMIILFFLWANSSKENQPQRKPEIKQSQEREAKETQEAKWYIKFSVKNQKATAYTEERNAPRPSSGQYYFIGGIAVHPRYPVNSGGDPRVPLLPYGTIIHLDKPVKIHGQEHNSFTVMDTGDINYRLWSNYPYWLDIYFGNTEYYNVSNAREYGTDLVDYYWYEEWK